MKKKNNQLASYRHFLAQVQLLNQLPQRIFYLQLSNKTLPLLSFARKLSMMNQSTKTVVNFSLRSCIIRFASAAYSSIPLPNPSGAFKPSDQWDQGAIKQPPQRRLLLGGGLLMINVLFGQRRSANKSTSTDDCGGRGTTTKSHPDGLSGPFVCACTRLFGCCKGTNCPLTMNK